MINELLHRQPAAVDRNVHRGFRLRLPVQDWRVAERMNWSFVAAAEFSEAARDFPIVFVRSGGANSGSTEVAPIVVLGVKAEQNLFVEGGAWRGRYMPAAMRLYPFGIGRVDAERFAVCIDAGWSGINATEGKRLFDDLGQPSQLLADVQRDLEQLESEVQRTRLVSKRLVELDLLREKRFDATLADGSKLAVDGFLAVDEEPFSKLSDATIVELHQTGVLSLIHAHFLSLGNMRRLVDWHQERSPAA